MPYNGRVIDITDVSADTGELGCSGLGWTPPPDEQVVNLRMRIKTNVPSLLGLHLVTVRWNDGVADQEWNVSLSNILDGYAEQPMQIWADPSRVVTAQIKPLVAGGSVDVRILGSW